MVNTSFQSVELSLPELLLSRAPVRFTQPDKLNLLTDTVYFTLPSLELWVLSCGLKGVFGMS